MHRERMGTVTVQKGREICFMNRVESLEYGRCRQHIAVRVHTLVEQLDTQKYHDF